MYYPCSENKGADQRLCFRIYANCWFSHEAAHFSFISMGCRFTIYSVFFYIHNLFKDIHNSFMDILNSFMDILK